MPVEVECAYCGDTKEIRPSSVKDNNFCDRSCMGKYMSENNTGKNNRAYNSVEVTCSNCGKIKTETESRAKRNDRFFCDKDCKAEWQSDNLTGENNPFFGKQHTEESIQSMTKNSGNPGESNGMYGVTGEDAPAYGRTGEDHPMYGVVGQDHPNWMGGKSLYDAIVKNLGGWYQEREEYRQNHDQCELCGDTEGNISFNVHHTIPILSGGIHEQEMFMYLCNECHNKVESYTKQFTEPIIPCKK